MLNVLFRSSCVECPPTRRVHSAASLSRLLTIVLVGFGVLLGGCRVDTRPKIVSTHAPGQEVETRKAPRRGIFRLYEILPATGEAGTMRQELFVGQLRKGERIGFVRQSDGGLFAVAGRHPPQEIDAGKEYLWQMRASADQIDGRKTTLAIVTISLVALVVLAALVADAVNDSFGNLGGGSGFYSF